MARESAGLLLYRRRGEATEVFLVHPGGPFWKNKDEGAWTIPKGEPDSDEAPLDAARRELTEETGLTVAGPFLPLEPCRQKGGKLIRAWAAEADFDASGIECNSLVRLEWPPRSGRSLEFPEIDRAGWFDLPTARRKANPAQAALLDELELWLARSSAAG